jgi:Cu(I)/Ag(I) efflux system protein CusF
VVWQFSRAGKIDFACLQPGHYDAGMKGAVMVAAEATSKSDMTEGEVRKVDKENKKLTLKHAEIKSLGMPSMTMVFRVKDAAMLDQLRPGDPVRFSVEKAGGAIVVTHIGSARTP